MSDYLRQLQRRPLVLDGAMGTVIYQRGVFVNACYDELSLTNPGLIAAIHREYAAAGADLLLTNTFGANRLKLRGHGLGDKAGAIIRAAVALAREAAGGELLVAGDAGPCLDRGRPLTEAAEEEVEAAFREQFEAMAEAGADLIFLETFSDPRELALAAKAARATGLPVHASFSIDAHGATATGHAAAAVAAALQADANVDTIGLNCSMGPAGLLAATRELLPLVAKPLLVKPNAGFPRQVGGRLLYMATPEYFTEKAKELVRLGVRGVGGCCGTTPAHIRHMALAVKCLAEFKPRVTVAVPPAEPEVEPLPAAAKSRLGAKLARGERVTSVEILPPKAPDMTAMIEKVRACQAAGVDAVNIPDGPRATARVSPLVAAMLIRHAGLEIEPVPHYCCRDRNLLGMQSDILGAAAAGIRNLLVITGDPPKSGDTAEVRGVFDVDSIGLARLIRGLNRGLDFGRNPVSPPAVILIGVGANPCALDLGREVERFRRKIEAGAEYAITQPVFDADALLRFLDRAGRAPRAIPVLAGIFPLASFRNAEFMRNEVPGVVIPDAVMERLARCRTGEEARETGIELAREMIGRLAGAVAGFQVSAPFGNVGTALRVLGLAGA
jgi:methionine synthase I (cobalamin-dependent)/5,10-methylenetetrahydrofolate reductase